LNFPTPPARSKAPAPLRFAGAVQDGLPTMGGSKPPAGFGIRAAHAATPVPNIHSQIAIEIRNRNSLGSTPAGWLG
jgi:hypothetical protein